MFKAIGVVLLVTAGVLGASSAAQATSLPVTTLTGFNNASGVAFSQDGSLAFVVEDDDGTMGGEAAIKVVDSQTLAPLSERIPAGVPGAGVNHAIVMAPNGTKAYVSLGAGVIKPFYPATRSFGPAISLGTSGIGQVVFSPDGTKAYAAVTNNGSGTLVKALDVATDTVTASVTTCGGPDGLAITPDGAKVFVNCSDGTLAVIEAGGNTVIHSFTPTGHLQGTTITMAPDGANLYVTAFSIPSTVTSVINTTTYGIEHQFTDEPKDAAFNADGSLANIFSASSGDLIPTNSTTFASETPIDVMSPSPGEWFLIDKNPAADQYWISGAHSVFVVGTFTMLPNTGAKSSALWFSGMGALALLVVGAGFVRLGRRTS